ncbi:MAG: ABC transporter permease, partial [Oscillospiraceae bacterium]|nr:ABC transporter permease [Oscillospiraceae bacterium]
MKWLELLEFSVQSLWRRKLRSVLTLLGVMIGTASIVVMMSLGIGLNASYMEQLENSATLTRISVYSYGGYMGGESSSSEEAKLDKTAIESFAALEHVVCASPVYEFSALARAGKYEGYLNVMAMSYEMLLASKLPVIKGALPERGAALSFIVGSRSGYNFYDPGSNNYYYGEGEPPVDMYETPVFVVFDMNAYYSAQSGQGTAPKKYLMETSAVVGTADDSSWSEYDYNIYADLEAVENLFQKLFKKNPWPGQQTDSKGKAVWPMSYNTAYVLVDEVDNVSAVQQAISDMGYQASSDMEYLQSMQQQSRMIQYVLAGIGSVSLIVAAIGIANTMLMSIFER